MTQAFNLSQFANSLNSSGQTNISTSSTGTLPIANGGTGTTSTTFVNLATNVTGALPITNGGTNNGSLAVTAGGVVYTDGTKLVNVGAGTSGQVLQSNGASAPTWGTSLSSAGGGTEISTASDITLTSSSNRVQRITQTATGKKVKLPDATTLSSAGGPLFQLAITSDSQPMYVAFSDGGIFGSLFSEPTAYSSVTGANISTSNITNAQTGYSLNNSYPVIKNFDNYDVSSLTSDGSLSIQARNISIDQLTTDKYIITYVNTNLYAVVATKSGNTFTFGTPITVYSANTASTTSVTALSATTALVTVWVDNANNGYAYGLTISGTSVTASTISSSISEPIAKQIKLSSTQVVVGQQGATTVTTDWKLRVITHNGASAPTLGTTVSTTKRFANDCNIQLYLITTGKFIFAYRDGATASGSLYVGAATVSGSTITKGTELVSTQGVNDIVAGILSTTASDFLVITDETSAYYTVSGTTITFGALTTKTISESQELVNISSGYGFTQYSSYVYTTAGSLTKKTSPTYAMANSWISGAPITGSNTSLVAVGLSGLSAISNNSVGQGTIYVQDTIA